MPCSRMFGKVGNSTRCCKSDKIPIIENSNSNLLAFGLAFGEIDFACLPQVGSFVNGIETCATDPPFAEWEGLNLRDKSEDLPCMQNSFKLSGNKAAHI